MTRTYNIRGREVTPTDEQLHLIDEMNTGTSSIVTKALAGAAKSTTLEMAAQTMRGRNLALAFNVSIKDELKHRMPSNFEVMTMNGLGHRAWQNVLRPRKLDVSKYKTYELVANLLDGMQLDKETYTEYKFEILRAVGLAKAYGLVVEGKYPMRAYPFYADTEEGWQEFFAASGLDWDTDQISTYLPYVRYVMQASTTMAFSGKIDFNDQIYMPIVFKASMPSGYEQVICDEQQDFSLINLTMIQRLRAKRYIGVGDENQAIYGFRGASKNSMTLFADMFKAKEMTLNTTFRCAKNIVKNVHWKTPHMKAAPWAVEGDVFRPESFELADFKENGMIVCRNNGPLVSLAFKLIGAGIPVTIKGSEITQSIIGFMMRIARRDKSMSAGAFISLINEWEEKQIAEALDRRNPGKAERTADKAAVIKALPGSTVGEMIKALEDLFANTRGKLQMTSIHGSKGLEADHVYHLDQWLLPSRFAITDAQKEQEDNLRYVADTRAKLSLTYIYSDMFRAEEN